MGMHFGLMSIPDEGRLWDGESFAEWRKAWDLLAWLRESEIVDHGIDDVPLEDCIIPASRVMELALDRPELITESGFDCTKGDTVSRLTQLAATGEPVYLWVSY